MNVEQYQYKGNRELELIKDGLTFDSFKRQWTAKYPWIKNPNDLPNNFTSVFGQLKSLEKRLKKSPAGYSKLYGEQMNDMVKRNVARKLTDTEILEYSAPVHYIPHHGVTKTKSSTPLRVVFNSSAVSMGHKLNDYWAKGPDVLNTLLGVLLQKLQLIWIF